MTGEVQAAADEPDLRAALLQLIEGYRSTAVLHVAARLGIADLLSAGAKDAEELAAATGADTPSLRRLLQGLTVLGVLDEFQAGRFRLTRLGTRLQRDAPDSLRRRALRSGDETEMRVWGNLLHSVRTGETAFAHVQGMDAFEYLAGNPAASAAFNREMVAATKQAAPALLAAYDFSRFGVVVDVGGGSGAFLAEILKAYPGLRGAVFDTRAGSEGAAALLAEAGVAGRGTVVEGDFFEDELPSGADAYVVKSVIEDWDDDHAVALLRNCRRVMPADGRLVVITPVMPGRIEAAAPVRAMVMFDLSMLVNSGGRGRTEAELAALFVAAGFALTGVIATDGDFPFSVVEGTPDQGRGDVPPMSTPALD